MKVYYYFQGDTPQRAIYSRSNSNKLTYINSGARFICDHFPKCDEEECFFPPKSFSNTLERDESLPLRIYELAEFAIDDKDTQKFLGHNDYVYRLEKILLELPGKPKEISEDVVDSDKTVVVVWVEKGDIYNIPQKADYYIFVVTGEIPDPDFLKCLDGEIIMIVPGDILRNNGAMISKGLAWEETAIDTVWQFRQNPSIRNAYGFAKLLIVPFGLDGAIVMDTAAPSENNWSNTLWFQPTRTEGDTLSEYVGFVPESLEMFATEIIENIRRAFTHDLNPIDTIKDNMDALLSGLVATHMCGYSSNSNLCFKCNQEMRGIAPTKHMLKMHFPKISFVSKEIPSRRYPDGKNRWNIPPEIEMFHGDSSYLSNVEKLRKIVEDGAVNADLHCPIMRIGALEAVGRTEIEAYSAIKNLLRNYIGTPFQGKPLSIAVFGEPGSGKSFGVKEIAKSIMGGYTPFLEYNLSQYGKPQMNALYEIFHDIQDHTMEGKVPIVFFDEFDSNSLGWLKFFLMPMQDGKYIENGRARPIGKCILVFAGGIYHSYEKLRSIIIPDKKTNEPSLSAKENKVPDFLSRIKGYIDIAGVNPPETDKGAEDASLPIKSLFIIKRAMMLSSMLKRMGKKIGQEVRLDDDVLRAFLYVNRYFHGARSMEAILDVSRKPESGVLKISDIPSFDLLRLHVDSDDFYSLMKGRIHWEELIGRMARNFAWYEGLAWESLTSKNQLQYQKKAIPATYILREVFGLQIHMCGDYGEVNPKDINHLVLLTDHGKIQGIGKEKLMTFAHKLYVFSNVESEGEGLPKWEQLHIDVQTKYIEKAEAFLRPFDNDPKKTGLYLCEFESLLTSTT